MIWGTIHLFLMVKQIFIGSRIYSDHAPVILLWGHRIQMTRPPWKINNSVLKAKGVTSEQIQEFFEIILGSNDVVTVWETFNTYIRGELISQTSFRKKRRDKIRTEMVQRISSLAIT